MPDEYKVKVVEFSALRLDNLLKQFLEWHDSLKDFREFEDVIQDASITVSPEGYSMWVYFKGE